MKQFSLTISLVSVIFNSFLIAKDSQASPTKLTNTTGQELHQITKTDLKAPILISKQNDFLKNDIDIQLNSVKIKHPTYQNKITKVTSDTSNTIFIKSEFKNTFKDVSSTFTSNYGPVSRAPDESLKHCTSKACLE